MADSSCQPVKSRGGKYCVAGGPQNQSCTNGRNTPGVSLHCFPSNIAIREKWTAFVRRHRPGWTPSPSSCLCSVHFEAECFNQLLNLDLPHENRTKRVLERTAVPTIDIAGCVQRNSSTEVMSDRSRRHVSTDCVHFILVSFFGDCFITFVHQI